MKCLDSKLELSIHVVVSSAAVGPKNPAWPNFLHSTNKIQWNTEHSDMLMMHDYYHQYILGCTLQQ